MRNRGVRKVLLLVAGAVFLFSAGMVSKHNAEMRIGAAQAETVVQEVVTVVDVAEPAKPPAPQPTGQTAEAVPPSAPDAAAAVEVVKTAPIQVDFDALCGKYPDVAAWLYCPDSPINYPVVQSEDNAYYLHRLLDGRKNSAGTLFMDYRNSPDLSDWNCIIYGHNMTNDSMFGTLTDYKSQAYFEAHPEMYLLTPERSFAITLMAGFTAAANDELYSAFSPDESERERLVNDWLAASDFYAGITPDEGDRLITLSTCSYEYDNARYVLVGILQELRTAD